MLYKDYQELTLKCVKKYAAPQYLNFMMDDEILHGIFTQIVKAGERYDPTKTKMTKEQWCAYNGKFAVFDFFSKMKYKKLPKTDFKLDNSIKDKIGTPLDQLIDKEDAYLKKEQAYEFLTKLNLTNKESIVAQAILNGYTFEEIAKMTNVSKASISFTFRRLKNKIWDFTQASKMVKSPS